MAGEPIPASDTAIDNADLAYVYTETSAGDFRKIAKAKLANSVAPVSTGQMFYIDASGNVVKLNAGSNDDFLTLAAGIPAWSSGLGSGGNGIVAKTGSGTYAKRTITGTANQIVVTDGDGVSANPTISLPSTVIVDSVNTTGSVTVGTTVVSPIVAANDYLALLDTNNTHYLRVGAGSNLTADRTLTIITGDQDNTLDVSIGDPFAERLFHVQHQVTSGTAGGSSSATTWNTRTLNTTLTNEISGASLASNKLTLPAGEYWVDAWSTAFAVDAHKLRLYDVTAGAALLFGSNGDIDGTTGHPETVILSGRFTLSTTSDVRLEHYTETARATNGLGLALSVASTPETHASVAVWKVG